MSGEVAVQSDNPPAVIQEGPANLLSAIVTLAKDPGVDVAKLQALLSMQERMEARDAEAAFNVALHAAQAEMPRVKKNGTINLKKDGKDLGSIPFARFEDMDTLLRPIMDRHGFSISFDMQHREGGGGIITGTLLHERGHSQKASMPLALDTGPGRNNLQAMGSTLSYGKRYILEMLFHIVREGADDDGHAGGQRFITQDEADLLRVLLKQAGRQEMPFLDRLFSGSVRSFEEVEAGAYVVVRNTLDGIIHQKAAKAKKDDA